MAQVLKSFLFRKYLEDRLGCRTFDFDFQQDVVVDVRNGNTDGGIHRRAHVLLRRYTRSHQNAVVMLDKKFGGTVARRRSKRGDPSQPVAQRMVCGMC